MKGRVKVVCTVTLTIASGDTKVIAIVVGAVGPVAVVAHTQKWEAMRLWPIFSVVSPPRGGNFSWSSDRHCHRRGWYLFMCNSTEGKIQSTKTWLCKRVDYFEYQLHLMKHVHAQMDL
jgi:hypothetical protein